jgi:hypothetical protein
MRPVMPAPTMRTGSLLAAGDSILPEKKEQTENTTSRMSEERKEVELRGRLL